MATTEQIDDLYRFAKALPDDELRHLTIDEIYDRWRRRAHQTEDLLAVQASLQDYEAGERGRPVAEFLADFDAERAADA